MSGIRHNLLSVNNFGVIYFMLNVEKVLNCENTKKMFVIMYKFAYVD